MTAISRWRIKEKHCKKYMLTDGKKKWCYVCGKSMDNDGSEKPVYGSGK